MKGFTKIALILSLVLVILGSMFCMIGLGIGFNFSEFWEEVENAEYSIGPLGSLPVVFHGNQLNWRDDGESWNSSDTEQFAFSCQGKDEEHKVERLDLDVYYGTVNIEKQEHADEIQVVVEYRKQNHRRKVEAYKDGTALMIKETGGKRSIHNDSTRITIRIPASMNEVFKEISLKQDAGDIFVNMPLTAEEININVNAGECQAEERLKALRVLKAEVGAGEIELEEAEAEEIVFIANVGQITADWMDAKLIDINCGIGSIEAEAAGREQDYSYEIKCGIGEVTIGDSDFSGISNKRRMEGTGTKEMKVDCNIGDVEISYTED